MAEASEVPLPQGGGDGDGLAATVGREEALQMMALTVLGAGAAEVDVVLPRYASGDADAQEAELAAIEGPLVPEEPVVPAAKRKKKQLKEKLADRALRLGLRAFGQAKVMRGRLLVFLVRRPLCSLALLQLLMFGLIGAMWKEGGLDTDFDSFLRANSNSSLRQDAYTHAWQVSPFAPVKKEGRRLQEETGRNAYHMLITVMYRNEVGGNILEEKQLYAILKFEQKMQARERWRTMCSMSMAGYGLAADDLTLQPASCSPGESLVNYVWPSYINGTAGASIRKGGRQQLVLDGKGNFRIPIPAVLSALRDEKDFFDRLLRFLPEGFSLPESGGTPFSDSVMSHFLFSPAGGPGLYYKTVRAAKVGVEEFLSTDIHEALNEKDKDLEELGIRVFYSAGPLDEADMFDALWKDCRMAIGGLVLVLIMVRIHTQSLSLSAFGSWLILESLPLGYVFFKQFTSLPDISVVNCLCIFVIVGIGSDFIFVLTDGWRQIEQEEQERAPSTKVESMDPREQEMRHQNRMRHRLVAVWRTAGVSCITTGLCAASSFLVNLVSVLLPLREFGLFMGLCCLFALFLELLMYPLALVAVDNAKFRKRLAAELEEGEDALTPEFSSTAVVPCEVSPEGRLVEVPSTKSAVSLGLRRRSVIVRFFAGRWTDFVSRYASRIILAFLVAGLVCVIVAGAVIKIDGGKPVIFPSSHNQVAGKALLKRYAPQTALAVQSSKQQAYLCSPTADLPGEPDTVPGCSTWSSMGYCTSGQFDLQVMCPRSCGFSPYCLAHWCDVAKPPNATKEAPGRCECFRDGPDVVPPAAAALGVMRFETTVVGFGSESWAALEPYFRQGLMETAGAPGSDQVQKVTYSGGAWSSPSQVGSVPPASGKPPLVQQHWRSGSLSSWQSFKAPDFSVLTQTSSMSDEQAEKEAAEDNETVTVKQHCYCDGIAPCESTSGKTALLNYQLDALQGVVGLSTQVGRSRRLQESSSPVEEALAWTTRAQEVESEMLSVAYGSNSDSPLLSAAFEPPRRLAAAAPGSQLNVIWGLKVRKLGPFDLFVQTDVVQMWDFDEMFDPADPWAQRSLMQMGEVLSPGLLATSLLAGGTWIAAYEEWLLGNGLDFPARDFHSSSEQFVADRPDYKTGVLRDGAQIKALKMDFRIGVASVSGLSKSLEVLQAWDQHVQTRNEQASMRANSAFHTSSLWVRVAAQNGILTSTASSVLISVMLGFVFAMAFTGDFVLSLLPMASVVLTVVAMLFVMVGLLQWPFGAIDVIGLIVFLGYMFTFNLHMVHSYHAANVDLEGKEFLDIDAIAEEEATTPWIPAEGPPVDEEVTSDGEKVKAAEQRGDLRRRLSMAEVARDQADQAELRQPMVAANTKQKDRLERFERSKHALTTMGQSLLCSGITSSACAIFLVACTLQFFVKFGVVILAVTVLSLLHSLVFLPALLMLLGPTQNSCASLGHLRVRAIEALKALNARQMPLLELHVTGVLRGPEQTAARLEPPLPPPADHPSQLKSAVDDGGTGLEELRGELSPAHKRFVEEEV